MTVRRRLGIALGLHAVLLAVLLWHHVGTIRAAVTTAHDLSDVSARLVMLAARQGTRLAQLDENAAKYAVTRDAGYLAKFAELRTGFTVDLEQALALATTEAEGAPLRALAASWEDARAVADGMGDWRRGGPAVSAALETLRIRFEAMREALDASSEASQATMRARLAASSAAADRAERLSWIAAVVAVLLSLGTAVALVRSITGPLQRLREGTREVARGRFGYRLDTRRGDEFAQVAEAFNAMTERLGTLDRMKQDFVSTVSHDLKSPLASLRETNMLLLEELPGPLAPAQRRLLILQRESADRLGRMIGKLLDLSRLEAGLPVVRRPVLVATFVRSVAEHAAAAANERTLQVRVADVPPEDLYVPADEDRLRALMDNLVENAIKFSPPEGIIEISAAVGDGILRLEVTDEGPGVHAGDRERIFERFAQTPAGRAVPARGIGLGLTICREVAHSHGGTIAVTERPGGGSRFVVELPGAQRAEAAQAAGHEAAA